jgi:hypothetical protein
VEYELDHLFVCVSERGDAEADCLAGLGLIEGEPNRHSGQGTACRRFLLANAFLELIWVYDADEAQSEMARPLRLWERWSGRSAGACPFGVCLRPSRPGVEGHPFPAWRYRPIYLPEPLCFHVGTDSTATEGPLLVYLPFGCRPDTRPQVQRLLAEQASRFREITRVLIRGPGPLSPMAEEAARRTAGISFEASAGPHLLEIGFDGERAGCSAELQPLLPLRLLW